MNKELDVKKALFMFDLLSYLFHVVSQLETKEINWTEKICFVLFRLG